MAGVRFRPAFSNDDPEAPMEVYCAKITRALVKRVIRKCLLVSHKNPWYCLLIIVATVFKNSPEIVSRYRTIKSHSIVGEPKLMSNHVLFSGNRYSTSVVYNSI